TVELAGSSLTVVANPNPTVFGQPVTITVTVSADSPDGGTPTGVVTISDGVNTLGTGTLDDDGVATFTTADLGVGGHDITASYAGDGNFNGSADDLSQLVNKAASSVALASNHNPSVYGQSVTFTVTVSAASPGSGTPSGDVTFTDGTTT